MLRAVLRIVESDIIVRIRTIRLLIQRQRGLPQVRIAPLHRHTRGREHIVRHTRKGLGLLRGTAQIVHVGDDLVVEYIAAIRQVIGKSGQFVGAGRRTGIYTRFAGFVKNQIVQQIVFAVCLISIDGINPCGGVRLIDRRCIAAAYVNFVASDHLLLRRRFRCFVVIRAAAGCGGLPIGGQRCRAVGLADFQRDRFGIDEHRKDAAGGKLDHHAAVVRAVQRGGTGNGQLAAVLIGQVSPCVPSRIAALPLESEGVAAGRKSDHRKSSGSIGQNTDHTLCLAHNPGGTRGRGGHHRNRLDVAGTGPVARAFKAHGPQSILILDTGFQSGIGEGIFTIHGITAEHRALNVVVCSGGVIGHIAANLIVRRGVEAGLPGQRDAVRAGVDFHIPGHAGGLSYACDHIAQDGNGILLTAAADGGIPGDEFPIKAVIFIAVGNLTHRTGTGQTGSVGAAPAAADGDAALETYHETAGADAGFDINTVYQVIGECGT